MTFLRAARAGVSERRRFSAEYKQEAVAMLETSGVSVTQIATELGIGVGCTPKCSANSIRALSLMYATKVTYVWKATPII